MQIRRYRPIKSHPPTSYRTPIIPSPVDGADFEGLIANEIFHAASQLVDCYGFGSDSYCDVSLSVVRYPSLLQRMSYLA